MAASKRPRILWLLIAATLTGFAAHYLWEFILVDKCLDAGGQWDHKAKLCDTTPDHPTVP